MNIDEEEGYNQWKELQVKKHLVSFSGGKTSAYLVYLMEQKRINEGLDVKYIFIDTGGEHPETYKFIKQCVAYFKIKLTCLKCIYSRKKGVGPTYKVISIDDIKWDLSTFKDHVELYGNFTINRPNCTEKIKRIISQKYRNKMYGSGNYFNWLGMRIDEPKRLRFLNTDVPNPDNIRYLAEISDFDKSDIVDWWSEMPFQLSIPEHLGNCVFCVKKSTKKIALAQRDEPELFKEWCNVVTGPHVRLMPSDKFGKGAIYREWLSPNQVIAQFSHATDKELRDIVYRGKKDDTGECSESCEGFDVPVESIENWFEDYVLEGAE